MVYVNIFFILLLDIHEFLVWCSNVFVGFVSLFFLYLGLLASASCLISNRFYIPCFEISHEIPTFAFVLKLILKSFLDWSCTQAHCWIHHMRPEWTHFHSLLSVPCFAAIPLFWELHPWHVSTFSPLPERARNRQGYILTLKATGSVDWSLLLTMPYGATHRQ